MFLINICIFFRHNAIAYITYYQFRSVAEACPTLCDTMNRSTPGLPVHHKLPEFTQTHVYRVGDAIQPSHPLSSPSPPAPNPFQHQGLFQWVNSSHEVAKVLEFQLLYSVNITFIWTGKTNLYDSLWYLLYSSGLESNWKYLWGMSVLLK